MLSTKKSTFKKFAYILSVAIVGLAIGLVLQFAKAWTEPTATPPGDIGGPITMSSVDQTKGGGLTLNTGGNANGLIVAKGNVGIGTASPGAKLEIVGSAGSTLKIVDGNQAAGKVLTSDGSGNASWKVPGGGNAINMYKCPPYVSLGGGSWGFQGCEGQITNLATCKEIEFPKVQIFNCSYVGKLMIQP